MRSQHARRAEEQSIRNQMEEDRQEEEEKLRRIFSGGGVIVCSEIEDGERLDSDTSIFSAKVPVQTFCLCRILKNHIDNLSIWFLDYQYHLCNYLLVERPKKYLLILMLPMSKM